METLKLRVAVKHWPRAAIPKPETIAAGTQVRLIRRETATLFTVTLTDASETFPVLASEVDEMQPA